MIVRDNGSESDMVRVTFRLSTSVWAESVHLVGDFNNWSLAYQYRYLLDRTRWCNDWQADRYVPNIFGGDNSVLDT